jgi:glucokinase
MNVIGAVDVGGTKIAVGLVNASGEILDQEVMSTDREKDFEYGLARIQEMLALCLRRNVEARLLGVGVGCTGPVDPLSGVLGPNSFLPLWEGVNTITRLQEALGVPVAIENDADAAALGEVAWGAGQGASRCIYVTVSTGIGCGVVLDGRIYRGARGAHPELGHLVIDPERGPLCYCGARGCWESMASGPALSAWYAARRRELGLPLDEGPASDAINASAKNAGAYTKGTTVDAREVCLRARQGDPAAQEAVLREGYYLGIGMANLISAFVPEVIVLGGGVMGSWELFEGRARALIRQSCGLVPHELTLLRPASLGARTGLSGAARVWFHRYGEGGR